MATLAPSLIVVTGPSLGRVVALGEGISIGRDSSNHLVINDLALSRHHCRLDVGPHQTLLTDIDSLNGTLVNDVPIRSHALAEGDQIRIGDSILLFVAGQPAPAPASQPGSTAIAALFVDAGTAPQMQFTSDRTIVHDLIGESEPMRDIYRRIGRAAPTDSTVLIQGESGTGKELVARAIHANSERARGPFVAINCAALPEGLMESELFGHEKGAFTGAIGQKRGRIELGDGGTIFFDEIGELPLPLQAKLLRVLQERTIERVGGARSVPVNIRVVAATNRDLSLAAKDGSFRQDLFYRLNVVNLEVPPLRERQDDLPLLITYFVRKHAARSRRKVRGVTREARARLIAYGWPGNVRELENAIERALVLGSGEWVEAEDLPEYLLEGPPTSKREDDGYHVAVSDAKRRVIRDALQRAGGNVAKAARQLGLQPTYLHRLIRNLGVRDDQDESGSVGE
jgi:transcriptional regulator with PAS, ATPase and Fis domain